MHVKIVAAPSINSVGWSDGLVVTARDSNLLAELFSFSLPREGCRLRRSSLDHTAARSQPAVHTCSEVATDFFLCTSFTTVNGNPFATSIADSFRNSS